MFTVGQKLARSGVVRGQGVEPAEAVMKTMQQTLWMWLLEKLLKTVNLEVKVGALCRGEQRQKSEDHCPITAGI